MNDAVTFGRYSIFTLAHLSTVQEILRYRENLVIGLILSGEKASNYHPDNNLQMFYDECDNNYVMKILLDINIRNEMILNTLEEFNISNRVNVVNINRPEYYPDEFNYLFDTNKYDLFFPQVSSEDTCFDIIRNQAFEKILNRKVYVVKPKLTIHLSQIQKQYKINKCRLVEYLPKATCDILEKYPEAANILEIVDERNV